MFSRFQLSLLRDGPRVAWVKSQNRLSKKITTVYKENAVSKINNLL